VGLRPPAVRERARKKAVAIAVLSDRALAAPAVPYRGIRPFRYADHTIFFARERECEHLARLISIYRGTLLYGATGSGKSSLINAGLLPHMVQAGFQPERVRVQPRAGESLVIERIPVEDEGDELLPSLLADGEDGSDRAVLSPEEFERRVEDACSEHRLLLVFDQFEELCTLFRSDADEQVRRQIVELLVRLMRARLSVKLLFVFREDYLSKVKELLAACPELIDQALLLQPLAREELPTIILGPFRRFPGHFARELDPSLAKRLEATLAARFDSGDLSLSEVQTVCLRLWLSEDPERLLSERDVQGLLEDYLGEALAELSQQDRFAAVALLGQMVTAAGTRNVISAQDLVQRVCEEDPSLSPVLLEQALDHLEGRTKLVRRERRRDLDLYEITSEFLVPWISAQHTAASRLRERWRDRRRLLAISVVAGLLLAIAMVFVVLLIGMAHQRKEARDATRTVSALALSSAADEQVGKRLDVPLLLALGAYELDPGAASRDALMRALAHERQADPLALMHGHRGPVQAVATNPRGDIIASAGADRTVRLWSARTHRELGAPLLGHTGTVTDVAFAPRGDVLASGSEDGTVRLWSVASHRSVGRPLRGHRYGVAAIAISPDGRLLASASYDWTVRIWSLPDGRPLGRPLRLASDVTRVAFSPDGRTLVTGTQNGVVCLWDVATKRSLGPPLRRSGRAIVAVGFGRGGRVAAGSSDGVARIWSVVTHRRLHTLALPAGGLSSLAFSPDGGTLATTNWNGEIRRWDAASGRPVGAVLQNVTAEIEDVTFSPDGRTLDTADWDGSVRIWPLRLRNGFNPPLRGHRGAAADVAFDGDGRMLASAGDDGTVRLWSVVTRRQVARLAGHSGGVDSIAFSPDGTRLASGSSDGTVRLWEVATRAPVRRLVVGRPVTSVAFSPDGATLAAASRDGKVRLWSVMTGALRAQVRNGGKAGVYSLAFDPSGRRLATGSGFGRVRLWEVSATGSRRVTVRLRGRPMLGHTGAVRALAFSPDGSKLASASSDETVRLWNVGSHRSIGDPLRDHKRVVYDVAFSPDGRLLASAGADSAIRLWNVDTQTPFGMPLTAHGAVRAVAFDRDGTMLASADGSGAVRLWPGVLWHRFDALRRQICDVVGEGLTRAEWAQYVPSVPYRQTCPA
jgi:WD40 repeat protein